uniref:Apple domain-containing protein n=1 Tax=Romanomermis culicivorax TaxID=13658 RepID=A0A915KPX3_ROMCU
MGVLESLIIKNPSKIRNLFFSSMVDRYDNDFNPTNFIALLKCGQQAGHLECLVACSHDRSCTSVNYIPEARICLLSWSDYQVRPMEDPGADFFKTTLYIVPLDGMSEICCEVNDHKDTGPKQIMERHQTNVEQLDKICILF